MELSNQKLLVIIVVLGVIMVGLVGGIHVLTEKAADRVIEKLQKDYSPSPYGPGIDPDKLDVLPSSPVGPQPQKSSWHDAWEADRR